MTTVENQNPLTNIPTVVKKQLWTCAQHAGKISLRENLETLIHAPLFYQPAAYI